MTTDTTNTPPNQKKRPVTKTIDATGTGIKTIIACALVLSVGLALIDLQRGVDEPLYQGKQFGSCSSGNALIDHSYLRVIDGDTILFRGDSVTADYRKPYHYGKIVGALLDKSYCNLIDISIFANGRRGQSYADYARTINRSLRTRPYDFIITEDAGVSLPGNRYTSAVGNFITTIRANNHLTIIAFASTPGLEEKSATGGNAIKYTAANNWQDHNKILEDITSADPYLGFIPWRSNSCQAYTKGSDIVYTVDGIHPTPRGHLLYALSIVKWLGAKETDLNFTDLPTLDSSLDVATAQRIASLIYGPQDAVCNNLLSPRTR